MLNKSVRMVCVRVRECVRTSVCKNECISCEWVFLYLYKRTINDHTCIGEAHVDSRQSLFMICMVFLFVY